MGIRKIDAAEAKEIFGESEPKAGIFIPYPNVVINGKPYGRLRYDKVVVMRDGGEKKYHQAPNTGVHCYVPADIQLCNGDLIMVEGEFKSISLTEAGFSAIGTSGFYSWRDHEKPKTNPPVHFLEKQFEATLKRLSPARIVFLGDSDTALNSQFSDAMVSLATMTRLPVVLPRIEYNAPDGKGVDDIRGKLDQVNPAAFAAWFSEKIRLAEVITHVTKKESLAMRLFEREIDVIAKLTGDPGEKAKAKMVDLATVLGEINLGTLAEYAKAYFQIRPIDFRRAVKAQKKVNQNERRESDDAVTVDPNIFNRFVVVGTDYYGYSIDPATHVMSKSLSVCQRDLVTSSLIAAGYVPWLSYDKKLKIPGGHPNLNRLEAAMAYLNSIRVTSIVDRLFKPYGRIRQQDGTSVFNNSRVTPCKASPDKVTSFDDPRIEFTRKFLGWLFYDEQVFHLLTILSFTYMGALSGKPKKPLAIFLVGDTDAGKSLFIDYLLPAIHGQDSAADAIRLFRGENGASSVLKSYVCKLSDKDLGDYNEVKRLQSGILSLLADFTTSGKLMYQNVTVEEVYNLFAFSSNPDGSVINLLKYLSESIRSKMAVYACGPGLPMVRDHERLDINEPSKSLAKELPHFCSFLIHWATDPASEQYRRDSERFGVTPYFSPKIEDLFALNPEEAIVYECLLGCNVTNLTATAIYNGLANRNLSHWPVLAAIRPARFGEMLQTLAKRHPTLVQMKVYPEEGPVHNRWFTITGRQHQATTIPPKPQPGNAAAAVPF